MPKLVLKPAAMYGINEYATKWIVIVKRNGKSLAKSFAFSTHGGRSAALAQAQAWRDEQIHAHPTPTRRELAQKVKRNNTSGTPGVRCDRGPDGRPRRWVAHTQIAPGEVLTKSFGVKRYGYEQAQQMAIAERHRQLEQMKGRYSRHPADQIDPAAPPHRAEIQWQPQATRTGIAGVELTYDKKGRPQSWVARTMIKGKRWVKPFAIVKYGEEQARTLAIAERERQLRQAAKIFPQVDPVNPPRLRLPRAEVCRPSNASSG